MPGNVLGYQIVSNSQMTLSDVTDPTAVARAACDFIKAPIGAKLCRYQIEVVSVVRTNKDANGAIISFDNGETWQPDETHYAREQVIHKWNKLPEE